MKPKYRNLFWHFFNSLLPLLPASQTFRHQQGDYCRELTSAHRQKLDSNREPLVSESKSLTISVVDSIIFGIHCYTFFQQTSSFPKRSVKTSYEKTQRYELQLHLKAFFVLSEFYFDQKFDLSRITGSKNPNQIKIIPRSSQFTTECVRHTNYYMKCCNF